MDSRKGDSSSILPAALHMVRPSQQYALQVVYEHDEASDDISMPCQKVFALIRSTQTTQANCLKMVSSLRRLA